MSETVVVIGDALLDVTARPSTPMQVGADVPAEVRIGCGGQGANMAIRLRRQGIRVELICGLGDDAPGSLVTDALRADGVRLNPVAVDATGAVVILLDEGGERTMLSQRAPFASGVSPSAADWTVLSGYCLLEDGAIELARAVAGMTTRRVVVGCAVPVASRAAWRGAVAAAQPDLFICNRAEAAAMAPLDAFGGGTVVTARDAVTASVGGVSLTISVPPGPPAIDTTGAGDAFVAALVARLVGTPWPPPRDMLASAMIDAAFLAGEVARAPGAHARVAAEPGP